MQMQVPDGSMLIDYAFYQSWMESLDMPALSMHDLEMLRQAFEPLITDALDYYLANGQAPLLEEEDE